MNPYKENTVMSKKLDDDGISGKCKIIVYF